jgi:hypothetical protein
MSIPVKAAFKRCTYMHAWTMKYIFLQDNDGKLGQTRVIFVFKIMFIMIHNQQWKPVFKHLKTCLHNTHRLAWVNMPMGPQTTTHPAHALRRHWIVGKGKAL